MVEIKFLQMFMVARGLDDGGNLICDGVFGEHTRRILKVIQRRNFSFSNPSGKLDKDTKHYFQVIFGLNLDRLARE